MGDKMSEASYRTMIEGDLEWLLRQPATLERDHIALILRRSVSHEYGPSPMDAKPSPVPHFEMRLSYHDLIKWIEKKHDIDTRDYAGRHGPPPPQKAGRVFEVGPDGRPPLLDFWWWLTGSQFIDLRNGSYRTLCTRPSTWAAWHYEPSWVTEILSLIDAEYPEMDGEVTVWVEW